MSVKLLICTTIVLVVRSLCEENLSYSELKKCDIGPLAEEIASYQNVVNKILNYTMNGPFKGRTYNELANFVDKFGGRVTGSKNLEKSIDHMIELTKEEYLYEVITDFVEVPYWQRGEEELSMLEPRLKKMALLGLGLSVPTPPEGITAEVIVISNFTVLESTAEESIKGKIVLLDPPYTTYGETKHYREHGASKAAAKGAVAFLLRSVTPFSINSPHTGSQTYDNDIVKIPAAAITLEDADLLRRIHNRGQKIIVHLKMNSTFDTNISRNILVDYRGKNDTKSHVIISGHIDSWDVGQGAMDDGGGLLITWAALVILKQLRLVPKRTIRAVYWTGEELGLIGAYAYERQHRSHNYINFIMESDEGTFAPLGLAVGGTQEARCIIAEILKLFKSINATTLVEEDSPGSDISVFTSKGVPGASLYNDNEKYFWFHHSEGDTMNVENTDDLDRGAGFWAAVAYVIADISENIPREIQLN